MAHEDKEVPSISYSSHCDDDGLDYDDDDDNNSSIVSKLVLKCKNLLSKKKFYKQEFLKMSKEFKIFKNKFSEIISLNEQLSNDLKASSFLKCELN